MPRLGQSVNAEKFSDYNGGKVYFCCDNCKGKFDKDSSAFAAKANHQLVCSGQFAQKACPLSGGKVKDGTEVDVAGVKVSFCCMNCKGKAAKATGDDQVKLVFGDGFAKVLPRSNSLSHARRIHSIPSGSRRRDFFLRRQSIFCRDTNSLMQCFHQCREQVRFMRFHDQCDLI